MAKRATREEAKDKRIRELAEVSSKVKEFTLAPEMDREEFAFDRSRERA